MYAKFQAIGRLTKDPSEGLRYVKAGGEEVAVCTFSIACDPETSTGEADFYDCEVWRKSAESLAKYMEKGKLIFVAGRPHIKPYEKDGVTIRRTVYRIDTVKFLDRGKGAQEAAATSEEDPF